MVKRWSVTSLTPSIGVTPTWPQAAPALLGRPAARHSDWTCAWVASSERSIVPSMSFSAPSPGPKSIVIALTPASSTFAFSIAWTAAIPSAVRPWLETGSVIHTFSGFFSAASCFCTAAIAVARRALAAVSARLAPSMSRSIAFAL